MLAKDTKKNKFRYGIKNKFILLFTIFTIIPLSVVGFLSYLKTTETITGVLSKYIEQTTQAQNTRLGILFDEAIMLLNMRSDLKTKVFLNSKTPDELYEAAKDMGSLFKDMRNVRKSSQNIHDVTVIGANGNCYSERNGYYRLKKSFYNYETTKKVLSEIRSVHIFDQPEVIHAYPLPTSVLSVASAIFKVGTNEVAGIIKVDIEKSSLLSIFENARWSAESFISILNADGMPIFQKDMIDYNKFTDANIKNVIAQDKPTGNLLDSIGHTQYLIVYSTLQATQWKILIAVPEDEISAPLYDIRNVILVAVFVSLVLVFLINTIISNSLVAPITGLKKLMKQASAGDFDVNVQYKGKDELSELYASFDKMVKKIKQLLESLIQEQNNLKISEFKSLQAQINPHFLYNTLDSVVRVAESNKIDQVIDLTISLSHFYKAVLSSGLDLVPMRLELDHAESYLKIMKMRYHDILDYNFDIDNLVLNYKFPKIILQPIIENAIYHGIKNTLKRGVVEIRIHLIQNKMLNVEIEDNGIGMQPEELEELKKKLNDPIVNSGDSYGLKNVNQRIQLIFGKQYGIDIHSSYNAGTLVRITVPTIQVE
jgi:two-component system sensor histidine kinase YesM